MKESKAFDGLKKRRKGKYKSNDYGYFSFFNLANKKNVLP